MVSSRSTKNVIASDVVIQNIWILTWIDMMLYFWYYIIILMSDISRLVFRKRFCGYLAWNSLQNLFEPLNPPSRHTTDVHWLIHQCFQWNAVMRYVFIIFKIRSFITLNTNLKNFETPTHAIYDWNPFLMKYFYQWI